MIQDAVAELHLGRELAAIHLGQPEPDLEESRLAIDAMAAVLDHTEDRLGPGEGVRHGAVDADAEAVAGQVPQAQLVAVQAGVEDARVERR